MLTSFSHLVSLPLEWPSSSLTLLEYNDLPLLTPTLLTSMLENGLLVGFLTITDQFLH